MTLTEAKKGEILEKEHRIKTLLADEQLDGLCLFKFMNFSWFTGGGTNRIVTGSEAGCAVILILEDQKYIIAPSNEIQRIMTEQVAEQGFQPITYFWYEKPLDAIKKITNGKKIGADLPQAGMKLLGAQLDRLRFSLTEHEISKVRQLAAICSTEMAKTCINIRRGMSELEVAAFLSSNLWEQGVRPAVMLVGSDERVLECRHPVPTAKKLDKYCLISMVGEKDGLHITISRSVHFGRMPEGLRKKYRQVLQVELEMIASTQIGSSSELPFQAGLTAYAEAGYTDEWQRHHQGGAIGYAPREYRAGEGRVEMIIANQMFGWNPTLQGTKSEETILTRKGAEPEILTTVPSWWPQETVTAKERLCLPRPLILEL